MRFVNERALVALGIRRLGLALAPLWLLTDVCENPVIYRLLRIYPASDDTLAQVLGPITHLKFAILVGCVAIALRSASRPHATTSTARDALGTRLNPAKPRAS